MTKKKNTKVQTGLIRMAELLGELFKKPGVSIKRIEKALEENSPDFKKAKKLA